LLISKVLHLFTEIVILAGITQYAILAFWIPAILAGTKDCELAEKILANQA
jgi:hypothetical protein